jgi:hypothetical protein
VQAHFELTSHFTGICARSGARPVHKVPGAVSRARGFKLVMDLSEFWSTTEGMKGTSIMLAASPQGWYEKTN